MARVNDDEEFVYKGRTAKTIHERATQTGGSYDNWTDPRIPRYKARDGKNEIRVLPPGWMHDEKLVEQWGDNWGIEVWIHYGVGPEDNQYLCPNKMLGKRCYLCEACSVLRKTDEKAANDMQANKRTLVYLIDRRDEEAGPQIWGMPWKKVEAEIQYRSEDKKKGALLIDHPTEGFDVSFNKSGKGDRTDYTGVEISREESALSDNPKTQKAWLAFVKETPLPKALIFFDNEFLEAVFNGRSGRVSRDDPTPGAGEGKPNGEARSSGRAQRESEKEPKKLSSDDVDDMDRNGLEEAIKDYKLDVDGDDFKKTSDLRAEVMKYLKKGGVIKGKASEPEPEPARSGRASRDDRLDPVNMAKIDVMDEDDLKDIIKEYKLDVDPEDYPKLERLRNKVAVALKSKDLLEEGAPTSGRAKRETKKLDPVSQDRLDDMEDRGDFEKLCKDYELKVDDLGDAPLKVIRREIRAALKEKGLWDDGEGSGGGGSSAERAQASIDRMKNKHRE